MKRLSLPFIQTPHFNFSLMNFSNLTGNSLAYGFNSSLDALVSQAFGAKAPALAVSESSRFSPRICAIEEIPSY